MCAEAVQCADNHGALDGDVPLKTDFAETNPAEPAEPIAFDRRKSHRTLTRLALLGVAASGGLALFVSSGSFELALAPYRWEHLALAALASTGLALGLGDLELKLHIRWTTVLLMAALAPVLFALAALQEQWTLAAHLLFAVTVILWLAACLLPGVLKRFDSRSVAIVSPVTKSDWLRRCLPEADYISQPRRSPRLYDILVVSPCALADPKWSRYISEAAMSGCEVWSIDAYLEEIAGRISCTVGNMARLGRREQTTRIYLRVKRALDLVAVAVLGLPALLAILLAAATILVTMGRPIRFTQNRVGLNGRIFRMHKLRTMRIEKCARLQIATEKNDKRITPIGAFLRRFHIDELPQLWNVLVGDMTLIGPRPEQPALVNKYTSEIPNFALRHNVKPGILGWAQLQYGYASTVEETREKLEYDLFYLRRISLALDLKILWQTVPLMLNKNRVR